MTKFEFPGIKGAVTSPDSVAIENPVNVFIGINLKYTILIVTKVVYIVATDE